ncbi:MAG TPA: hypothetical protein VG370_31620 [Chloroflexota bacterium]|jgi:hypothetical protein|nr:hypothetical protein [Chloroflexota bacterium]
MATSQSELGAELERRFYPFAEILIRLRNTDPTERKKALQTPYGRHIGYVLRLLSEWAEEGDYAGWEKLPLSPNMEKQILARASQGQREKQVKQLYR